MISSNEGINISTNFTNYKIGTLTSNFENIESTNDFIGNSFMFYFLIIIARKTFKHLEVKR